MNKDFGGVVLLSASLVIAAKGFGGFSGAASERQVVLPSVCGELRSLCPGTLVLGLYLLLLQAADVLLTSIGVERFGVSAEGNPLLRSLMERFGHMPTLLVAKMIVLLAIVVLCVSARRFHWIRGLMGAVCCVYLFGAIIPWVYILYFSPVSI